MNLPNKITLVRIFMIPLFVVFFYLSVVPYHYLISAVIFALASLTDFLDGHIARKRNLVTDLGKFLDPIADKVLVATALIVMLLPLDTIILPWYCAIAVAVIMARELMISGFRLVAAKKDIVIAADKTGKIKTVFQDVAIFALLATADFWGLYSVANIVGLSILGVATILTVVSGVLYLYKNKSVLATK